jgi:hypothetical protein
MITYLAFFEKFLHYKNSKQNDELKFSFFRVLVGENDRNRRRPLQPQKIDKRLFHFLFF